MANEINPTAWIAMGLLAVFILAINFGLISAALKRKKAPPVERRSKMMEFFRNPFGEEDRALHELSDAVKKIQQQDETLYKDQKLTQD